MGLKLLPVLLLPALPGVHPDTLHLLPGERVEVRYQAGDSLRALRALRFLETLPPLPALPPGLPAGVTLILAPTDSAFRELAGGVVPDWGSGAASPARNLIVMPAPGSARTRGWSEPRVLRHEWAHLGLHQLLPGLRIPRWFDEGYAQWASGGWSLGGAWKLRVALALGRAPPLDSLVLDWPRDRESAEMAYLLSATAVEYLVRASGERGLAIFLDRLGVTGSFPGALREVYGVTPERFEEDWKRYVRRHYGWLFVLSHSTVFWLLLALALLLLARVRRGRDREALARLRATEPPDRPVFWDDEDSGGP